MDLITLLLSVPQTLISRDLSIEGLVGGSKQADPEPLNARGRSTPKWKGEELAKKKGLETGLADSPAVAPGQPFSALGESEAKKDPPPKFLFSREIAALSACFLQLSARPEQAHEGYKPATLLGLFISSRQILCQCSLQLGDTLDNLTTPSDASRANFSSFRKGWAHNGSI